MEPLSAEPLISPQQKVTNKPTTLEERRCVLSTETLQQKAVIPV